MTLKAALATFAATTCMTSLAYAGDLTRVATVPLNAEITGLFVHGDDLFMNVQHPSANLPNAFAKATVGVIANFNAHARAHVAPTDDAAKQVVSTSMGDYQILIQQGDFGKIGVITGAAGDILTSNDPDFNAFVSTGNNAGYLFTSWENRPGGMSRVMIKRAEDGTWAADESDAKMLDFSRVGGTWVNCFGTLSPWGNPLSSEELYFDDTAEWNNPAYRYVSGVETLAAYLGSYPNPYRYGYIVEITDPAGTATPVKAFAMGRFSHENAVVMPDQKTVYLSDDGTNVVFFKFVADTAGDLGAGTLYAAKINQQGRAGSDPATTALGISWVELAHGNKDEITTWIAEYDGITQGDKIAGETNYISDADVAAWAAGKAVDNRVAFLESRKAALARGATAEFRKMEGVNINYDAAADGSVPYMYLAMSEITKGMSDAKGDLQLAPNKCGVVYEMKLDDIFNVSLMTPAIAGGPYDMANTPNACDINAISNPDNLVVLGDGTVLIGEDTGRHENNALWAYRPAHGAK